MGQGLLPDRCYRLTKSLGESHTKTSTYVQQNPHPDPLPTQEEKVRVRFQGIAIRSTGRGTTCTSAAITNSSPTTYSPVPPVRSTPRRTRQLGNNSGTP